MHPPVVLAEASEVPPPPPDYANRDCWAARPDAEDAADRVAIGEVDGQSEARVDVFFVHPTTHYGGAWNAAFDAEGPADFVDRVVLPHQAAVFNAAGRVYAPRYRQAAIRAFTTRREREAARAAMDLAYSDVERAFDRWASESDRPVIIAGHSQGAYHALRLLAARCGEEGMRRRLVAAYVVGAAVPMDVFERSLSGLAPCLDVDDTGCVMSWSTVMEGVRPTRLRRALPVPYPGGQWETTSGKDLLCTNPVELAAADWTEAAAHLGGVLFVDRQLAPVDPRVEAALTRARCVDGLLEVQRSVPHRYRQDVLSERGDLHLADYPLFWMDIRRDAMRRAATFVRQGGPAPAHVRHHPQLR